MSRAILERLGFERVGHVHILLDDFEKRERSAKETKPDGPPGPSKHKEHGT
jgi:hypothetical protein